LKVDVGSTRVKAGAEAGAGAGAGMWKDCI
jgi:hypothetical protein